MFKVGDKVVTLVDFLDVPTGSMGTIIGLNTIGLCKISILNPDDVEVGYFFYFHELRLATPLEEVLE